MQKLLFGSALVLVMAWAFPVHAEDAKYDIDVSTLTQLKDGTPYADQTAYKSLMGELGSAVSAKMVGPAETLGILGYEIDFEFAMVNINENNTYWQNPIAKSAAKNNQDWSVDDMLNLWRVHIRKGLPFSFEVAGTITHLMESRIYGMGLDIKWALQEGYKIIPDVALCGHVGTIMGTKNYSMLTAGGDFIISKTFGIGGLFNMAPYLGYSFQYVRANSQVLEVWADDVGTIVMEDGSDTRPRTLVMDNEDIFKHYFVGGLQVVATVVVLAFEAQITNDMQAYTFKGGFTF